MRRGRKGMRAWQRYDEEAGGNEWVGHNYKVEQKMR